MPEFAESLQRLMKAATFPQHGIENEWSVVRRIDLRVLIRDWDRLDREWRKMHEARATGINVTAPDCARTGIDRSDGKDAGGTSASTQTDEVR